MINVKYTIKRRSKISPGFEMAEFTCRLKRFENSSAVTDHLLRLTDDCHSGWSLDRWQIVGDDSDIFDAFEETNLLFRKGVQVHVPEGERIFVNQIYQVNMRQQFNDSEELLFWHLSIKRIDKQPCRDWRHFQWIKNELCGDETAAVEVYPPESKLVDTANQYHLWVFPDAAIMPFIFQNRWVTEACSEGSVQRPWPANRKPDDLMDAETVRAITDDLKVKIGSVPVE